MPQSLIVFGRCFPVRRSLNQLRSTALYVISFETIQVAIASILPKIGVIVTVTKRNASVAKTIPQPTIFAPSHAVTNLSQILLQKKVLNKLRAQATMAESLEPEKCAGRKGHLRKTAKTRPKTLRMYCADNKSRAF